MDLSVGSFVLMFLVGATAGTVNVMAGGGSLITLPVLLFLGFPAALANGTNRVAILIQNVVATAGFRRRGVLPWRRAVLLGLAALPGAIAGAWVALEVSDDWFRRILAVVIAAGVLTLLFPRRAPTAATGNDRLPATVFIAFLGVGFYGGFIQAGVGMVFLLVLHHLLRLDLVLVNAYKVVIIAIYTVPALAVFVWSGSVDWTAGLALALGSGTGGWVGAHLSVGGGERMIRVVVAVALLLMAVRLLF